MLTLGTYRSSLNLKCQLIAYNYFSKQQAFSGNDFLSDLRIQPKNKSVCIVGGGIIGVQSAFKLLENGYAVDLFDKNSDVSMECSLQNGGNLSTSIFSGFVSKQQLFKFIRSSIKHLISPQDYSYANYISLKAIFEQNFFHFSINALYHIFRFKFIQSYIKRKNDQEREEHEKSLFELSDENFKLYQEFVQKYPYFYPNAIGYSKGGIKLFDNKNDLEHSLKMFQMVNSQGIYPYKEAIGPEEISKLYENQFSSNYFKNYYGAILFNQDTSLHPLQFCSELVILMQKKYPEQFKLHTNTLINGFVIDQNTQHVVGVKTDKDKQFFYEKIVLACGSHTKKLAKMLKLRLPMINLKGYSIKIKVNENDIPCIADKYNILSGHYYISRFRDEYRVCGFGQICGDDYSIDLNLIQNLVDHLRKVQFNKLMNLKFKQTKFDITDIKPWFGFRPQSADDIPIISKVPKFDNVFINTGQGGKGIIWSFVSSQKLLEIVTEKSKHEKYSVERFILI